MWVGYFCLLYGIMIYINTYTYTYIYTYQTTSFEELFSYTVFYRIIIVIMHAFENFHQCRWHNVPVGSKAFWLSRKKCVKQPLHGRGKSLGSMWCRAPAPTLADICHAWNLSGLGCELGFEFILYIYTFINVFKDTFNKNDEQWSSEFFIINLRTFMYTYIYIYIQSACSRHRFSHHYIDVFHFGLNWQTSAIQGRGEWANLGKKWVETSCCGQEPLSNFVCMYIYICQFESI